MSTQKAPETVKCHKCGAMSNTKETILCTQCKNSYEFDCIGLSEKLYQIMYKDKKQNWKCQTCRKQNKVNIPNNEQSNITQRKKVPRSNVSVVGVSTDKSETPKNVFKSPRISSSPLSKYTPEEYYDSHILTQQETSDDPYFAQERLSRSHEHAIHNDTNKEYELREEIELLKTRLLSTETELENQILDNNYLNKNISKLNKELHLLKSLCGNFPRNISKENKTRSLDTYSFFTPPRVQSAERSIEGSNNFTYLLTKINNLKQSLLEAQLEIDNLNKQIYDLQMKVVKERSISDDNVNNEASRVISPKVTTISRQGAENGEDFKRILILGTQQCVGLASALLTSRNTSPYQKYKVMAETKPYARSAEVIDTYHNIDLKTGDKLILGVGENDVDLMKLTMLLRNISKKMYFCDIFLINVFRNVIIGEDRINNILFNLCNEFNNCHFVYCKNYNLIDICNSINYQIDCVDYKTKYLDIAAVKKHVLRKESRNVHDRYKKGTIPYYFAQKQLIRNSTDEIPHNNKPVESKKKKITEYFPRIKRKSFFREQQ